MKEMTSWKDSLPVSRDSIRMVFLSSIFILLTFLVSSSLAGETTIDIQYNKKTNALSLAVRNVPIREILAVLSREADIEVFISPEVQKSATIHLERVPLEKGIKRIARGLSHAMVFSRSDDGRTTLLSVKIFSKGKENTSLEKIAVAEDSPAAAEETARITYQPAVEMTGGNASPPLTKAERAERREKRREARQENAGVREQFMQKRLGRLKKLMGKSVEQDELLQKRIDRLTKTYGEKAQ